MTSVRICHEMLLAGVTKPDRNGVSTLYRYVRPTDDIAALTAMLHESYAPLAAAGMRFVASYQDAAATRRRMATGETILALDGSLVVGTITLSDAAHTRGTPLYDRPDVAHMQQFAVRPSHQRRGIGRTLIEFIECRAREKSLSHLALDTSEHAADLIEMYGRLGYRFVEYAQWSMVNYRSVILTKALAGS